MQIHEVHRVKFGGCPTCGSNKVPLEPGTHRKVNRFWGDMQNYLTSGQSAEMSVDELLKGLVSARGVDRELVLKTLSAFTQALPNDFIEVFSTSNGYEGPIGKSGYLVIWPVEDIHRNNEEYGFLEYLPGIVAFGSDGGGEAFAFDFRNGESTVVQVPFASMSDADVEELAGSFSKFLIQMSRQ